MKTARLLFVGLMVAARSTPVVSAADLAPSNLITFEKAEVGRPPDGFTAALTGKGEAGSWLVQDDPSAPSPSRVLAQTTADTTSYRFPLFIYDAISTADVSLSVKLKPISGTVDQAGGLVWRYQDPSNYYVVRANALESNVVLYKVEGGKRSDLKPVGSGLFTYGKKADVTTGRWQTLRVDVLGSRFGVFLDGEHLFDVEDETFRAPGKVGLWTKADSVTAFDDLRIDGVTPPDGKDLSSARDPAPLLANTGG